MDDAIHAPDEAAAAGEHNAVLGDIAHKLGAGQLQHIENLVHNEPRRTGEQLEHLRGGDQDIPGQAGLHVPPLDRHGDLLRPLGDAADGNFDLLGGGGADDQAVAAADIGDDGLVEGATGDGGGGGDSDVVEAQHRDIRGAAADVHYHVAVGSGEIQSRAQG